MKSIGYCFRHTPFSSLFSSSFVNDAFAFLWTTFLNENSLRLLRRCLVLVNCFIEHIRLCMTNYVFLFMAANFTNRTNGITNSLSLVLADLFSYLEMFESELLLCIRRPDTTGFNILFFVLYRWADFKIFLWKLNSLLRSLTVQADGKIRRNNLFLTFFSMMSMTCLSFQFSVNQLIPLTTYIFFPRTILSIIWNQ